MKNRSYKSIILVIGFLIFGALMYLQLNAQTVQHVSAKEFKKLALDTSNITVDVRTNAEFIMGHIEGAILIDFKKSNFKERIEKLDKTKSLLLYCRSGNRSKHAANMLEKSGFKSIYNLKRGIIDWKENDYPLVK